MSLRYIAEVTLPGAVIGFSGGLITGGMAVGGGLPLGYAIIAALGLGIPLAILGAGYDWILASGRIRLGGVAPAALYWLLGFPIARLLHEVFLDIGAGRELALPEGILPFLAYQAILSLGYTIGFIWLHENLGAYWWIRIRDHNPVAARYVSQYTRQAATLEHSKKRKKSQSKAS